LDNLTMMMEDMDVTGDNWEPVVVELTEGGE
jgi:hypothetical protein